MTIRSAASIVSANFAQVLFVIRSANMQSVADQQFSRLAAGSKYLITSIVAVNKTGGATIACAGGIYSAAAKTGDVLVAAAQSWVTLAANVNVVATLAPAASTALCTATPFLSLTTGSTAACTADIFISGYLID